MDKRKFLNLTKEQQHKKCAELLRETYLEYISWMGLEQECPLNKEALSNLYHFHLNKTGRGIKEHNLLPTVRKTDRHHPLKPPLPIAIYLDNLRSAHNVGSIIRTTEGLSLGTLYFSETTPFIDNKKVADTAMGAEKWVECIPCKNLSNLPRPIIALETSDQAENIYTFSFPETFTLIIGNEEYGCSEESLRLADHLVEIPLYGRKNSLNAANAFAIAASTIRAPNPP